MTPEIPIFVRSVLKSLEQAGYSAQCVGGCVRDLLLGRIPDDWDVTTSALPEETMAVFGADALPTGLKHGTVTVRMEGGKTEVTTYRCDGDYGDHRHPDHVSFTASLEEDLRRRDFTVNAMALSPDGTLIDPFFGQKDLTDGVLRCVGDPDTRFNEDALRILRCLRFSSVLGFSVAPETDESLRRSRELLREIAPERVQAELLKLLCGKNVAQVLLSYPEVLGVVLPEITPSVGFDQRNRHHCWDVWEHTVYSVEAIRPDPALRMAMLLHDLGKPASFCLDGQGNGHFCGHQAISGKLAAEALRRLRFDSRSQALILTLVENHDRLIPRTEKGIRRGMMTFGEGTQRLLLEVKRADNLAQAPAFRGTQQDIDRAEQMLDDAVRRGDCVTLRQMAVNGNDLTGIGVQGKLVGEMLNRLLLRVVDGELPNERSALLAAAAEELSCAAPEKS